MAFPTTGLLTSFTGADQDPLSEGGNWLGPARTSWQRLRRTVNASGKSTSLNADAAGDWWNLAQFGADQEVYATLTATASGEQLFLIGRLQNPGNATTARCFTGSWQNGTGFQLHQHINGSDVTLLAGPIAGSMAVGDKLGLECIGTTIRVLHQTGGVWSQKISVVNAVVAGAGYIGAGVYVVGAVGTTRFDDFSGGTVTAATVPGTPQNLQAVGGDSQISLTWNAPVSNGGSAITNYRIYRSVSSNGEVFLVDAGLSTSYTDSDNVINGNTYYYRVSAFNAIGEGIWSSEVSATAVSSTPPPVARFLKRFYGPTQLANAAATLYTCPASTLAVVRHIHVSNPSGAPVDFTLSIGTSAAGTRIWDAQPIPADDVLDHYQEFTLVAGEIIQGFASSAATLNLTIDGYELGDSSIYPSDTLFPHD